MRKIPVENAPIRSRRVTVDLAKIGLPEVPLVGIHDQTSAAAGLMQHIHEGLMEICYLKRGERVYRVKGRDYLFRGNELFVTFPGEPHGSGRHAHGKGLLYWMQLRLPQRNQPFLCLSPREAAPLIEALRALPRRCFTGTPQLAAIFEELYELHVERPTPLQRVTVAACLLRWLLTVIRCARSPIPRNITDDILAALRALSEEPERDFRVGELAAASRLSTSRFKAKFKAQVGIPPREYLLRRKVEQAQRMLADGHRSVTDVAFSLGFSSSQYFATVFKRFTHRRPREARGATQSSS
jgi:AraC-like DNA-binding protein